MLNKINKYIINNNLLDKQKNVVVAVSGGADSICLLHILNNLGYKVILAHVNHNKRKESIIEQNAMQNLAQSLQIPFELLDYHYNNNSNFHDDSHNARYDFFKKIAKKYHTNQIVTAHHLDDQAETILIKLINGSNLYGYGGISNKTIIDDITISRPLLCVSKDDIYQYVKKENLHYFEDMSNQENDFLRNRIRHNILPLLKDEEPALLEKLQEYSVQVKEAFNYIRMQSIKYLKETQNKIDVKTFSLLDDVLKKDIICLLLERYPVRKNNEIILDCLSILNNPSGNKIISLQNGYSFVVSYNIAEIKKIENYTDYEEYLDINNQVIILNQYRFYFSKKIPENNAKYIKLCYNCLKLPLKIRNKRNGDFIKMSYGSKKVARLMIDNKIPTDQRKLIPLVFDNNNELLWVVPIAKSQEVINQKSSNDIYLVCEEVKND